MQVADYTSWVDRTQTQNDQITSTPVRLMRATLDVDHEDTQTINLPPLWHWLYFLQSERHSNIGIDGHPQRGGFLPPVSLPRRMWAGGRLHFIRPIPIESKVKRDSRILSIQQKNGRSGSLVFVTVKHDVFDSQGLAISEEQDIVYRDAPQAGMASVDTRVAPTNEQFARTITPDPVLLMRYSALTFNGHRIHFDRPYATETEGYPGLVVHGPLIATLLMENLRANCPHKQIGSFEFKAVSPLFDVAPFTVAGRLDGHCAHLWAQDLQGNLAMNAKVNFV